MILINNLIKMTYITPSFEEWKFTCPNCDAIAKQDWNILEYEEENWVVVKSKCHNCEELWIWFTNNTTRMHWYYEWNDFKMIYPKKISVPLPNSDLEQGIQDDYLEAANILNDSPRWAGALLRFSLQNLMIQLWEDWQNINKNIWELVKKWLNPTIQKALDSVRIIGNEAVHPWELDLKDDINTVTKIFWLINVIANALITIPKQIEEDYWKLPEGKIEWVENRDN